MTSTPLNPQPKMFLLNLPPRTPTVFQFTREARMTLLDFISQIGGLLGLFMGFSVISFVEVFYWFSFRLVRTRSDPM